eukprot:m.86171 g.86171  ORF g.86171 m.86171 type:complete len:194 (+) comp25939_c0_seq1:2279-2860(+)
MANIREVKLCLLGASGVGKTSLVQRFNANTFEKSQQPTIGASFTQKDVRVGDQTIRYKIWDTAGQEKFRGLTPMYFRGAEAAILVYDITQQDTFDELAFWVSELRKQTTGNITLAIAANKSDLESERVVDKEAARQYSIDVVGALFLETSAKTASNVETLFADIAARLPEQVKKDIDPDTLRLLDPPPKKSCC